MGVVAKTRLEKVSVDMGKIAKSKVTEYDPISAQPSGGHKIKRQRNKTASAVKKGKNSA